MAGQFYNVFYMTGQEYDVVVVGSGAAGMVAALTAAHQGLSTVVVEKAAHYGGSTARSGGGVWIPNNEVLKRDGVTDTPLPPAKQPLVVTEDIALPGTFQMVWSPDRPGNWLFHCHKPVHMAAFLNDMLYDRPVDFSQLAVPSHGDDMSADMSGLVLGITVLPAKGVAAAGAERPMLWNRPRSGGAYRDMPGRVEVAWPSR